MKITVIGTGYVGLVTGACFASIGHHVTCIEHDAEKLEALSLGNVPFFEPGLSEIISAAKKAGQLSFREALAEADGESEVFIIAVGTPEGDDGHPDMKGFHAAIDGLIPYLGANAVVVTKSTVPVGTGDAIAQKLQSRFPTETPIVISNPEFLREGSAVRDFMEPDRIVVGLAGSDLNGWMKGKAIAEALYKPLLHPTIPILFMDRPTAELSKYAANTLLATRVAFINEIADICEKTGADVRQLSKAVGLDTRIGTRFLRPGPGFGGSCFPKDTEALAALGREMDVPTAIAEAVVASNKKRKQSMGARIIGALGSVYEHKTVALLGLTFKPNTDDMRASPALDIIDVLQASCIQVVGFDPQGMENCRLLRPDVTYAASIQDCVTDADVVVVVTEWGQFQTIDPAWLKTRMRGDILIDLRNIFDAQTVQAAGLQYLSIGHWGHKEDA